MVHVAGTITRRLEGRATTVTATVHLVLQVWLLDLVGPVWLLDLVGPVWLLDVGLVGPVWLLDLVGPALTRLVTVQSPFWHQLCENGPDDR